MKDAKEQGRKKKQSGSPKETYYAQLANAIFLNDEDPEFNKSLKQTGAGLTYDELQKNLQTKALIDSQLSKFPWWPDLHGWWRTNPAYNTVFSTADPGKNYESAALQHFRVPNHEDTQVPVSENEPQEDADIEDGEIIDMAVDDTNVDTFLEDINPTDTTDTNTARQADDDVVMGQSDQFSQVQHALASSRSSSLAPSLVCGSISEGSYAPLPRLRPPITPISTHYSDRNVISLNSPEPQHDDESDGQYSFFSSFKKPTSNHDTPPTTPTLISVPAMQ
ncbi:hypothetical protein BDR05DRAFT_1005139 [Suillus weaverae]|nr:hypothetical protein BDR05DRAFT_1005139 [Suillus weaverae]